jgi:hypothetical protein
MNKIQNQISLIKDMTIVDALFNDYKCGKISCEQFWLDMETLVKNYKELKSAIAEEHYVSYRAVSLMLEL